VESHATISPANRSASQMPNADLPEAVGPTMATRNGSEFFRFIETGDAARA
jgi:hypothetical protein